MKTITSFGNESDSLSLGEFTVENRTDRVSLYGNLDLTRDKAGLQHARALKALLGTVVATLEAVKDLPDKIAPPAKPETVNNPFG